MAKLITTRFATKCRKCRQEIPQGNRAYWTKGMGTMHTVCPSERGNTPTDAPTKSSPLGEFEVSEQGHPCFVTDFATLKADYLEANEKGTDKLVSALNQDLLRGYPKKWSEKNAEGFYGVNAAEMTRTLHEGFNVGSLENVTALIPLRPRRKVRYQDEGDELLLDLALSGEDNFYIEWEKRESKPGVNVVIECSFNSSVQAAMVSQYGRWVARALFTLESLGFDCVVSYRITTDGAVSTGPMAGKTFQSEVKVKRANEASDFTSWSSLFSPGGFRHLGFLSIIKAGDHFSGRIRNTLGRGISLGSWDVLWNTESRTLRFGHPQKPTDFPEWKMTEAFSAALSKIQSGSK